MLSLMAYAGLRVGEVEGLNISDLNYDNQGIRVLGKGQKVRFVHLPSSLFELLNKICVGRRDDLDALFISRNNKRISKRRIQEIADEAFKKLVSKKEYSHLKNLKLSSHKLKHSFGTNMVEDGVDIRTVQELMGHESLETTKIYTHVSDKRKEEVMRNMIYLFN